MNDFFAKVFVYGLVALVLWVFLPRTWHFGDEVLIYPVELGVCSPYGVCDVEKFYSPLKLRVDEKQSQVVWLDTESGAIGSWRGCTIADKENWHCSAPLYAMSGGSFADQGSGREYISGWSYRLYWLLSFLPRK